MKAPHDPVENARSPDDKKHCFFVFLFTSLEVHQHTVSLPKGHRFINYAFHNQKEWLNWNFLAVVLLSCQLHLRGSMTLGEFSKVLILQKSFVVNSQIS